METTYSPPSNVPNLTKKRLEQNSDDRVGLLFNSTQNTIAAYKQNVAQSGGSFLTNLFSKKPQPDPVIKSFEKVFTENPDRDVVRRYLNKWLTDEELKKLTGNNFPLEDPGLRRILGVPPVVAAQNEAPNTSPENSPKAEDSAQENLAAILPVAQSLIRMGNSNIDIFRSAHSPEGPEDVSFQQLKKTINDLTQYINDLKGENAQESALHIPPLVVHAASLLHETENVKLILGDALFNKCLPPSPGSKNR